MGLSSLMNLYRGQLRGRGGAVSNIVFEVVGLTVSCSCIENPVKVCEVWPRRQKMLGMALETQNHSRSVTDG